MYLTLQRRTGQWLCLKKRIVGIENFVDEEEYNLFDKIPSYGTSYNPNSWELAKHCTFEATIVKNPYTEIKEEKASLISAGSFCNARGCVCWWKWNLFCNIKDAMYWWNFNPFYNIWDVVEFESCL
jgi:hypothetical protein